MRVFSEKMEKRQNDDPYPVYEVVNVPILRCLPTPALRKSSRLIKNVFVGSKLKYSKGRDNGIPNSTKIMKLEKKWNSPGTMSNMPCGFQSF